MVLNQCAIGLLACRPPASQIGRGGYAVLVGQVVNLRRIGNPPVSNRNAASRWDAPVLVGQPIMAAAAFQAASSPSDAPTQHLRPAQEQNVLP
jgi:hypothetical protein